MNKLKTGLAVHSFDSGSLGRASMAGFQCGLDGDEVTAITFWNSNKCHALYGRFQFFPARVRAGQLHFKLR